MVTHKVLDANEFNLERIIKEYEAKGWEVAALTYVMNGEYKLVLKRCIKKYAYDFEYAHSLATQGIS